jgi:uncharacterized phage protein gp47/JayE
MDGLSRIDLFNLGRQYALDRATRLDPSQVDVQGSDANVFVGSTSTVAYAVYKQLMYEIEGLLLATATGEQLDRLAWDRYQEVRKGATAAIVLLDFERPTADAGEGSIDTSKLLTTTNAIQYTLLEPASFGVSDTKVSGIRARAVQAGKDYQVGANYVTKFVEAPFDPTIAVNNPLPSAHGENREEDDDFRLRIQGFWQAARRGTKAAIEYGATQVDGVASASVVEALGGDGNPARAVTLYFADSSGSSTLAKAQEILNELNEWRAAGVAVLPSLSWPQIVDIRLHLTFEAGVDTATLTTIVRAAIVGYVNSLGANKPLLRGALQSVLQRYQSDGLIPNEGSIVSPAGDVVPDTGKTLRTQLENVLTV